MLNRQQILNVAYALVGVGPNSAPAYYNMITEGRKSGSWGYYGWCGDFVTYVLMMSGCQNGNILNRASLNGGHWTGGANLSRLWLWAQHAGATTWWAKPGDVVIVEAPKGDHIAFIGRTPASGQGWQTVNGNGQGGVVSLGGLTKRVKTVINVDKIPYNGPPNINYNVQPKPALEGNG
jgi:hypothetical protein